MDECDSASDVVKSVNLLVAIRWVALARSQVTVETIVKCFRKAGILDTGLDVICHTINDDEDPFLEADERIELDKLIEKTGDGGCVLDEFLTGDSDLAVCVEMDDDNWETVFFEESQEEEEEDGDGDDEIQDDNDDHEEAIPTLKSYKEAITALEEVSYYLEYKGHGLEALNVGSAIDRIVE